GVRHDLREKEPRSEPGIDQAGVLADPAESRLLREHPLLHGAAVDARERLETRAGRLRHPADERPQPRSENFVVVAAPRIPPDLDPPAAARGLCTRAPDGGE